MQLNTCKLKDCFLLNYYVCASEMEWLILTFDFSQQKLEPSNVKRSEESEDTEPIVSSMEALQLVSKKTINNDTQFNVEQWRVFYNRRLWCE